MTLIKNWKVDNKVELLVANGYMNLALSKQMTNLKPNKKKEILTWLKNNIKNNWCLKDILFLLKHKDVEASEIGRYASWSYDYHFCKWVDKMDGCSYQEERLYFDYKKMCKDLKKNWNDPYWSEPKDLRKAHNKVLAEHKNWEEVQEQIRIQKRQQQESERLQKKAFERALSKALGISVDQKFEPIKIVREMPSEGFKDFNEELLSRLEEKNEASPSEEKKEAAGLDMDGNGTVELSESDEKKQSVTRHSR